MGYIYLLESSNEDGTIYKIGYTKGNVQKRIEKLQTGNGYPIKEVTHFETKYNQKLERAIHNRYNSCRLSGEWFKLNIEDVASFIENCEKLETTFDILQENYFFSKSL